MHILFRIERNEQLFRASRHQYFDVASPVAVQTLFGDDTIVMDKDIQLTVPHAAIPRSFICFALNR